MMKNRSRQRWLLLVLPLVACSGDLSSSTLDTSSDAGISEAGLASPRLVAVDAVATTRLAQDRERFVAELDGHRVPLLQKGDTVGFERQGSAIVPRVDPNVKLTAERQPVAMRMPLTADDGFTLTHKTVEWHVRPVGLARVAAAVAGDALVYEDAFPSGALIQVPSAKGTEEYLRFDRKPARNEARYEVSMRGAAGYRLTYGVLELLTEDGVPRMRTKAPTVIDAKGKVVEGTIELEGCAFDSSQLLPWDRAVTPPGADACTVVTQWDDTGLEYPVLVDPAWTNTDNLTQSRAGHQATTLRTGTGTCVGGCVVVTGGSLSVAFNSVEIYREVTGTWAAATPIANARSGHAAMAVNGRVLVGGGWSGAVDTATTES